MNAHIKHCIKKKAGIKLHVQPNGRNFGVRRKDFVGTANMLWIKGFGAIKVTPRGWFRQFYPQLRAIAMFEAQDSQSDCMNFYIAVAKIDEMLDILAQEI